MIQLGASFVRNPLITASGIISWNRSNRALAGATSFRPPRGSAASDATEAIASTTASNFDAVIRTNPHRAWV